MFTFGRKHEKANALRYVRGEKDIRLVEKLIDSIHDFLDKQNSQAALLSAFRESFTIGGSGVWEQAANWLRRLSVDYPSLSELWLELAEHPLSKVRFRAACCLLDMPVAYEAQVSKLLVTDASSRVREMAIGKQPVAADS